MSRLVTVLLIVVLVSGCGKPAAGGGGVAGGNPAGADDTARYDRLAAGKLDDGDRAAEARGWLDSKNTSNVLWKTSRSQTLKYVNDLYQAGAVKVYAIYSPKDENIPINMCAELFLEMPRENAVRARVFQVYNRIEKELWGEDHTAAKEQGQKYLNLNMDP